MDTHKLLPTFLQVYTKKSLDTEAWRGFPGGAGGNESTCNAGDMGVIPGSGRSPEQGRGNPLQYSCLENLKERRSWGHKESDMTEVTEHTQLYQEDSYYHTTFLISERLICMALQIFALLIFL